MKNQVAALEKSLPTNLRSFRIPITAAYCRNNQREDFVHTGERVAYIEHHLVEELQNIAAEHEGNNAIVDLASQSREIDIGLVLDIGMFIQIIQGIIASSMDRVGVYIWPFLGHFDDRKATEDGIKGKKKGKKQGKKQHVRCETKSGG